VNPVYVGASDLVPQVNREHTVGHGAVQIVAFVVGLGVLFAATLSGA
jgi:hypothetical protein